MWKQSNQVLDMLRPRLAPVGQLLIILLLALMLGRAGAQEDLIPALSVESVEVGRSIVLLAEDLPRHDDFVVTIGRIGTLGVGGEVVGTVNSGADGMFRATFPIPDALKGVSRLSVRAENSEGAHGYDWFDNYIPTPPGSEQQFEPRLSVETVVMNESVTVRATGFPPNESIYFILGHMGTLAQDGHALASADSGPDGAAAATIDIPYELKGLEAISVRAVTNGYFAYNWFENQPIAPPVVLEPRLRVCGVVRDLSVTIETATDFPANEEFTILMSRMGAAEGESYIAGTLNTGPSSVTTGTFIIPMGLQGQDHIAIRAEQVDGTLYSFEYFANKDGVYCEP